MMTLFFIRFALVAARFWLDVGDRLTRWRFLLVEVSFPALPQMEPSCAGVSATPASVGTVFGNDQPPLFKLNAARL